MFPSTQPMDVFDSRPPRPGLAAAEACPGDAVHTALTSLSPSLMQDLTRIELGSAQRELLEVLAACIRHTQALAVTVDIAPGLAAEQHTLSVFPSERLLHCTLPMVELLQGDLGHWRVLQVQPAQLRPPGSHERTRIGHPSHYAPLAPLLWAVALRGARDELLPELAGLAAYRVAPGISLSGLDVPAAMAQCINRLRRQTSNLREIADWPGVGNERAMRLLNALYLQSGLIVSRSHPAATNDGWAGYC